MNRDASIFEVQIGKKNFEVDSLSSVLSIAKKNEGDVEVVQDGITVFRGKADMLQSEIEDMIESGITKFKSKRTSIPEPAVEQMQMSSHQIAARVAARVLKR